MQETQVQSLSWEDPLEKEIATHSSTLAWRIPWTQEPGGLQSMELQSWARLSDFTSTEAVCDRAQTQNPRGVWIQAGLALNIRSAIFHHCIF